MDEERKELERMRRGENEEEEKRKKRVPRECPQQPPRIVCYLCRSSRRAQVTLNFSISRAVHPSR